LKLLKDISLTLNLSRFLVTPFSFASCHDPLVTRDDSGTEKSSYLQNLQYCFMGCYLIQFSPTQKGILSGWCWCVHAPVVYCGFVADMNTNQIWGRIQYSCGMCYQNIIK